MHAPESCSPKPLPLADAGEGSSMMSEPRISRRRLVGAGAVGALGVLLAPGAVLADGENGEEVELLRWDLIQIVQGVVLVAQGTRLASVGADRTVRIWDLTNPAPR